MSKTFVAEIRNNTFPPIRVPPGTYVVWQNCDPYAHSAETLGSDPSYFNAGAMLPNETSSPVFFARPGSYNYFCRFHTDMTGTVVVVEDKHERELEHSGRLHGLRHYHGLVTGGWSGDRLYMSHTPVLADHRHNFQVIVRGHFVEPRHARIYEWLRESPYHDQVVQVFHDGLSMQDLGTGEIDVLPNASVSYWPGGTQTTIGPTQTEVTGLENVPIAIDEVIHYHLFQTEAEYPEELTYLMYGDQSDIFIEHFIDRAPSFHSVAKLASAPEGWKGSGTMTFKVPGRAIRPLEARQISRIAMVDNAYHLFWLLPPGALVRQAQDPLIRRGNPPGAEHVHEIVFEDGQSSEIAISRFLHFDIRLLNYGVLII